MSSTTVPRVVDNNLPTIYHLAVHMMNPPKQFLSWFGSFETIMSSVRLPSFTMLYRSRGCLICHPNTCFFEARTHPCFGSGRYPNGESTAGSEGTGDRKCAQGDELSVPHHDLLNNDKTGRSGGRRLHLPKSRVYTC